MRKPITNTDPTLTPDELNLLRNRYGLNEKSVEAFRNLDAPMRQWMIHVMELARIKGRNERMEDLRRSKANH